MQNENTTAQTENKNIQRVRKSSKDSVQPDGKVTMGYETHTVAQWQQIAELKTQYLAQLKALKDSFAK